MKSLKFSPKGTYLLQESAVIIVVSLLILVIGFSHSLIQYHILIFSTALLTLIGLIWFIFKQKKQTPLRIPILIWLFVYSISVLLSIDTRRSLSQMLLMLTSVFLFLLAYDLVSRGWEQSIFLKSFVFVGVLMILSNFYLAGTWFNAWITNNPGQWFPDITYRPATTNLFAPFMYLTFHTSFPLFLSGRRKINKIFLGLIMFSALFVLYLTSSRSGWLAIFFGLIVWGLYFTLKEGKILKSVFNKLRSNTWVFIGSIALTTIIVIIGGVLLYKQSIHPTHGSIFTSRSALWGPAIKSFLENPIAGQGQFTYGTSFLAENSTPPNHVYVHAHSLYFNLLAEMGILGFIAAIVFGISYLSKLKISFIKTKDKYSIVAIFAYFVSFFVHCIFDSLHLEPALIWPLAILTGVAIASPLKQDENRISSRPWWVIPLIGFAWFGIWSITPYYQGVDLANQNQWQPAFDKFQQAVNRDPENSLAHQQLALSAAVLAEKGEPGMLDIAIKELQGAIQVEPSWALNHANLAALFFTNYDIQNGISNSENAIFLAPNSSLFRYNHNPTVGKIDIFKIYSVSSNMRIHLTIDQLLKNEELQLKLNKFLQYSWAYNLQAKVFLEKDDLISAKRSLQNAELAYDASRSDSIETKWLWAEYFAKKGEYEKAIEIGNHAFNEYSNYGIFGPGTFGELQYAPRIFRMNAMAMEIIPQMSILPIPKIWVERSKLLELWELEN